jgi:hypothetical protein
MAATAASSSVMAAMVETADKVVSVGLPVTVLLAASAESVVTLVPAVTLDYWAVMAGTQVTAVPVVLAELVFLVPAELVGTPGMPLTVVTLDCCGVTVVQAVLAEQAVSVEPGLATGPPRLVGKAEPEALAGLAVAAASSSATAALVEAAG